jgi:protein-S-isoprenylcysteine O-methyltransferase Ste14
MSADQIASIKLAVIDFRRFIEQNKIDLERIDAADRDSARKMQMTTGSWVPGVLALVIVAGFFGILVSMMLDVLKVSDQQSLLILLGALSAGFGAVLNYYFGSSHGSQVKSDLLAAK